MTASRRYRNSALWESASSPTGKSHPGNQPRSTGRRTVTISPAAALPAAAWPRVLALDSTPLDAAGAVEAVAEAPDPATDPVEDGSPPVLEVIGLGVTASLLSYLIIVALKRLSLTGDLALSISLQLPFGRQAEIDETKLEEADDEGGRP